MQGITRILILFIVSLFLTSCSTLNPYHSHFKCPATYNGKCVSLQKAYHESKTNTDGKPVNKKDKRSKGDKDNLKEENKRKTEDYRYRTELYKEMADLLKQPATPFVAPPKVMRILVLPYTTKDNTLEMSRYIYFFATPPKWILSEEVNK